MNLNLDDLQDIARFVYFGLHPGESAEEESEYLSLQRRYNNEPDFRAAIHKIALGFRLQVLATSDIGLVLAPTEDSAFAMRTLADYPSAQKTADGRLVDGLIHVAILATVFPRARDLEEASTKIRPVITIKDVDRTLRDLCERIAAEVRKREDSPDTPTSEAASGLREAWRVYQAQPQTAATADERTHHQTIYARIQKAFEFLHSQRAFRRVLHRQDAFQATWRYHVLVQEFSANQLAVAIRNLYDPPAPGPTTSNGSLPPADSLQSWRDPEEES